ESALEVAALICAPPHRDRPGRCQILELPGKLGAHHRHARSCLQQPYDLLLRDSAAAHDDGVPPLEVQEHWIEAHTFTVKVWRPARVSPWSLRTALIQASKRPSARCSGSTLRIQQQWSGSVRYKGPGSVAGRSSTRLSPYRSAN